MAVATGLARSGATGLDRVGGTMVIAPDTVDRASAMAMALIMVRKSIVAVGTEIGTVVGTTGTNSVSVFSPETRLLLISWRASHIARGSLLLCAYLPPLSAF